MADQDRWTLDPSQRPFYCGDIAFGRVEAVLGGYYFVALRLKRGVTLLKQEPSAQIPWQKTMLGLFCLDMFALEAPWQHSLAAMIDRWPGRRLGESRQVCCF
jgi:hypothetical protein